MDLSSDPVAWARDRVGLCEDMWASDWSVFDIDGFGFRLHRSAMRAILSSYRRSLEIAARWVGGTHVRRAHPGDAGGTAPFQNVSLKRQREALDLVLEKGFRAGSLKFSPELLNKLMSTAGGTGASTRRRTSTIRSTRISARCVRRC